MAATRIEPAATRIEWSLIKGDSFDLVLPVLDQLSQPVDITSWAVKAQVRRSDVEPVLAEWSTTAGTAAASADGVTLHVVGTVTQSWGWRDAQISVEITGPDSKPRTIAYGTVRALPEITQ